MDRAGRASFGNRLSGIHTSDKLFLEWRESWGSFEQASRRFASRNRYYVRTDVRKFYPSVRRGQLIETVRRMLPGHPAAESLRTLILADGTDLPAGPTISGVLANMYLSPLDVELLNAGRLRGRYTRYVDDMFLFGSDRRTLVRTFDALRRRLHDGFGLATHHGKVEIGRASNAFDGRGSPVAWAGLSHDFDRIARTLYHVPPEYLRLYSRYPALTLRAYAQGLRAAGIFVSTDWLAQNFLTLRARKPPRDSWDSYFHLNFPRLNLKSPFGSSHAWATEFLRKNRDFARTTTYLRGALTRGFSSAFRSIDRHLHPGADAKRLKPVLFRLRFYASRLSIFNCAPLAAAFQRLQDQPWSLEPSVSATALLSSSNAVDRFLETLFSRRALLVRVRAAWALGELGSLRSIPGLWGAAHPQHPFLLRLASLEALIRIDRFETLHPNAVYAAARAEKSPVVRKYLYIILGRVRHPRAGELLRHRAKTEHDFFARHAAEFALSRADLLATPPPPARHAAAPLLPGRTRGFPA